MHDNHPQHQRQHQHLIEDDHPPRSSVSTPTQQVSFFSSSPSIDDYGRHHHHQRRRSRRYIGPLTTPQRGRRRGRSRNDGDDRNGWGGQRQQNGESLPHDHRLIVKSHHAHPPRPPTHTPSLPTRSPAFTHAHTQVVHAHPPHTPTHPYTRPCSPPHTQPQPLDYTPALALLPPFFVMVASFISSSYLIVRIYLI